jgi:hypothetical protein
MKSLDVTDVSEKRVTLKFLSPYAKCLLGIFLNIEEGGAMLYADVY